MKHVEALFISSMQKLLDLVMDEISACSLHMNANRDYKNILKAVFFISAMTAEHCKCVLEVWNGEITLCFVRFLSLNLPFFQGLYPVNFKSFLASVQSLSFVAALMPSTTRASTPQTQSGPMGFQLGSGRKSHTCI